MLVQNICMLICCENSCLIWDLLFFTKALFLVHFCCRLEGISPGSYEIFQNSRDLKMVIDSCFKKQFNAVIDTKVLLGTPVKPMLVSNTYLIIKFIKSSISSSNICTSFPWGMSDSLKWIKVPTF